MENSKIPRETKFRVYTLHRQIKLNEKYHEISSKTVMFSVSCTFGGYSNVAH